MSSHTFTITIEKVERETYQMDLQAETATAALDAARAMVKPRNKVPAVKYSVIKVESKEEKNVE